ncbi:hypothetical protein JCM14450A_18970 [Geobacillus stearothermophilus]
MFIDSCAADREGFGNRGNRQFVVREQLQHLAAGWIGDGVKHIVLRRGNGSFILRDMWEVFG